MARNIPLWFVLGGLLITWQSLLVAAEPAADAGKPAAAPPANARDFDIRVRFVSGKTTIAAPRVRIHDGQSATVRDETMRPFLIGETTVGGDKQAVMHIVNEGTRIEVRATSAVEAGHVLLDLTATRQQVTDDETEPAGRFHAVRVEATKKQLLATVRLNEKTVVEFDDLKLEFVVAAVE